MRKQNVRRIIRLCRPSRRACPFGKGGRRIVIYRLGVADLGNRTMIALVSNITAKNVYSPRLPCPFFFYIAIFAGIGRLAGGCQRLQQHGLALSRAFVDAQPAWREACKEQMHLASPNTILSERKR